MGLAYGEAPYQRLHPLKVMTIIIERDPPRIDRRKFDPAFASLIECYLQKDPKKRPTMEEVFAKHRRFFAKANEQPLIEILRSLPPLEQRIPPKLNMSGKDMNDARLMSGSWDFKIDEGDDADDDPLGGLEVHES